jgi:hypothetical protein
MKCGRKQIVVLCAVVIGAAILTLALLLTRKGANVAVSERSPSTPEEVIEATRRAGDLDVFLAEFAREATNAGTISQWRAWAAEICMQSSGKAKDSSFFDGVAIKKEELPQFVPHAEGLVAAAVVGSEGTNSHVRICWRGRDFFYGVLVSTNALPSESSDTKVKALGFGFAVYLAKAY